MSEPVIEYGLDLASIGKSGSDHSKGAILQSPAGKDSIPSGDRGKGSVPGVDRIDVVHRVDNKDPVPGVDRERTVVPVEVVDVPDQDINSTGSSVKEIDFPRIDILQTGGDIESRPDEDLVDALHLVCPQESTRKDVPNDGEASELHCDYIGKSVDEAEIEEAEADVSSTQLLTLTGTLNGVPVKFLVDSGASGNFISEHLVNEHGLQVVK